jgi:hypothetical protein
VSPVPHPASAITIPNAKTVTKISSTRFIGTLPCTGTVLNWVRTLHTDGTLALDIASGVPTLFSSERFEESVGCIPVRDTDDVDRAFRLLKTTIGWLFSTRVVIL